MGTIIFTCYCLPCQKGGKTYSIFNKLYLKIIDTEEACVDAFVFLGRHLTVSHIASTCINGIKFNLLVFIPGSNVHLTVNIIHATSLSIVLVLIIKYRTIFDLRYGIYILLSNIWCHIYQFLYTHVPMPRGYKVFHKIRISNNAYTFTKFKDNKILRLDKSIIIYHHLRIKVEMWSIASIW